MVTETHSGMMTHLMLTDRRTATPRIQGLMHTPRKKVLTLSTTTAAQRGQGNAAKQATVTRGATGQFSHV